MPSPSAYREGVQISGRYRVLSRLGCGSVGTVYLVEDVSTGDSVALKLIRPETLRPRSIARLQEEFRALVDLRHPQIAGAHDFGYTEPGKLPFYTREYVEGTPLQPGPPGPESQGEPDRYLSPILDLLDALEYLHAHGILHLDIHAGNLIVASDPDRGGILIDFGLGRLGMGPLSSAATVSRSSIAPELLEGEPLGPGADIYAVGHLLLYRLTGKYEGVARLPREIPGWGPRWILDLERILAKALERDPRRRFTTALEFRHALSEAVGDRRGRPPHMEPGELTVGRNDELEFVDEAVRSAVTGRTAVLWFFGSFGAGKTRLLTEARWRAQVRGLHVADLRFLPNAGSPPAAHQLQQALRGLHPSADTWLSPLAPDHGGSSADRTARAVARYFAEEGPPLVLLIDDLDQADRESHLLVEAFIAACVSSRRSHEEQRGLAVLVASSARPSRGVLKSRGVGCVRELKPLSRQISIDLLRTLVRPLEVPAATFPRLVGTARGVPLRLRQLVRLLHAEYGPSGRVPKEICLPEWSSQSTRLTQLCPSADPHQLDVLQALAAFQRGAFEDEIAAAVRLPRKTVARVLRKLNELELIAASGSGRLRVYYHADVEGSRELLEGFAERELKAVHLRAAAYLAQRSSQSPREMDSLARHLLAAGRHKPARDVVLEAVPLLVKHGLLDHAVRLLRDTQRSESSRRWRLKLAEEISEVHFLAGDHLEALADLEPLLEGMSTNLTRREAVRLRRRLGVHYHRAGRTGDAYRVLEEGLQLADPVRDREELVRILSELAEYHTLRGEHERAEWLCRRGLELLRTGTRVSDDSRHSMEVTLRATLGHLEARRMCPEKARREYEAALSLARTASSRAERAMILNNLGIVYNQLNRFAKAERYFRQAGKLLAAAGEQRALIETACNLGSLAAKRGNATASREHREQAKRLLREQPGERLEFVVRISEAFGDYLLGEMNRAIEHFGLALPLGRKLGDEHMVRFGEVYLAEAHGVCGNYREASRLLKAASRLAGKHGSPAVRRMAASRLFFLETLLGRRRAAREALKVFRSIPRSPVSLLEAWNDVFVVTAEGPAEGCGEVLERALAFFRRVAVPAGIRLCLLSLLFRAIAQGDTARVRALLQELAREEDSDHRALAVLQPLVQAEAYLFLGEFERSARCLQQAAGSVFGLSLPEMDWRIEFLRACLAERQGDRETLNHHLHRSLQARDLLVRSLAPRWRDRFLSHPRFGPLDELRRRAERATLSTLTLLRRREVRYPAIVGDSPAMRHVFEILERTRDLDFPMLIVGETGTGKEVVARSIHENGPRRDGSFHALSCSSLPEELFESELFGVEAGAFTGAESSRIGLLEHLSGGTILLDEITQLSLEAQGKVRQVIDAKAVRPLGSVEKRVIDVRFLASSSVDPAEASAKGLLRRDLYHRLRVEEIRVPALRSRKEDVPSLLRHFLNLHGRRIERAVPPVSPDAVKRLTDYDWPGNVRELETLCIRLLVHTSPGGVVTAETVAEFLAVPDENRLFPDALLEGRSLKELRLELERAYLEKLFRDTGGDFAKMQETLGVKQSNLYTWLRRVGLNVRRLRRDR